MCCLLPSVWDRLSEERIDAGRMSSSGAGEEVGKMFQAEGSANTKAQERKGPSGLKELWDSGHGGGRESEELGREEAGALSLTEGLAGVVRDQGLDPTGHREVW